MSDKIILTDVDGVLLNWVHGFEAWMKDLGYSKKKHAQYDAHHTYGIEKEEGDARCHEFDRSAAIGFLPPLQDAVKYVRKLHEEHGVVLHCITALPDDKYVHRLRLENLQRIFGDTVIERLECTSGPQNKKYILQEYQNSGLPWIEDSYSNVQLGMDLGLDCYFMRHEYNQNVEVDENVKAINNWKDFYHCFA